MPTFSFDWFSNNIGNWNKWLSTLKGKPIHALEIGCYEGKATCWLLENVLTHPDSTITVIDTFDGSEEHRELGVGFSKVFATFADNIKPWESKVKLLLGQSSDQLRERSGPYHFAYVDGSHIAKDVLTDACMLWPLMHVGGIVIFDDYGWKHYKDPTRNPDMAIDAFLGVFKGSYDLVAKDYQVCVRKTS